MFFSMKRKVVFVAMSGGVDSSVAALLLQRRGFEVVGVFMKNWSQNIPGTVVCSTEEDQRYARHVASQLRIPFYSWDFEKEYREFVFEPMVRAYTQGLTPNPDVACNQHIKFGVFFEKAMSLGADYIATGHYVGKTKNFFNNEDILRTAKDKNKDQSYFLWTLSQDKLKHCFFPIGSYQKSTVRAIARSGGLVTADKKDSQGICFLGKVSL
ncbi:MAG: tRNA-specific 2-thiouridylase MnmA, partial [Parcubacteria group bacterium GW2011_GWF1_45_5]